MLCLKYVGKNGCFMKTRSVPVVRGLSQFASTNFICDTESCSSDPFKFEIQRRMLKRRHHLLSLDLELRALFCYDKTDLDPFPC